jgi:hypothetical protein
VMAKIAPYWLARPMTFAFSSVRAYGGTAFRLKYQDCGRMAASVNTYCPYPLAIMANWWSILKDFNELEMHL